MQTPTLGPSTAADPATGMSSGDGPLGSGNWGRTSTVGWGFAGQTPVATARAPSLPGAEPGGTLILIVKVFVARASRPPRSGQVAASAVRSAPGGVVDWNVNCTPTGLPLGVSISLRWVRSQSLGLVTVTV